MQSKLNVGTSKDNRLKGQMTLNILPIAALSIVVFIMITALGTLILAGMNGSTDNADAQAVIDEGIDSMSDFAGWATTFVPVIAAGVIISLVFGLFMFRRYGGGRA